MSATRCIALLFSLCVSALAAGVEIHGRVTSEQSGAPIRGATVKATLGIITVSRYTDAEGRYRIKDLKNAPHQVAVSAPGFARQQRQHDAVQPTAADFALLKQFDPAALSSAEVLTMLPENAETRWLEARCIGCHGMTQALRLKGLTKDGWIAMFKAMVVNYPRDDLEEDEKEYAAQLAEKYFGPNAPAPSESQIKRVPLNDQALNATYYEYELPTPRSLPHSIVADNRGNGWFAETAKHANNIGKLNFLTGTLREYPVPFERAGAHTPTVGHDGTVWMTLMGAGRLAIIDPTEKIEYHPESIKLAHTVSTDSKGNIWGSSPRVFMVDPRTRKISYWQPLEHPSVPEYGAMPRKRLYPKYEEVFGAPYHVVADSKGMAWYTTFTTGALVRLNPMSGEQKSFKVAEVPSSRGVIVDPDDSVWYTNWGGHGIAKLDQKTGRTTHYKLPTKYAMPYSLSRDTRTGHIWVADYNGNNLTRFDPRTGEAVEFPIPTPDAYPRFISVDNQGRVWFAEWWQSKVGVLVPVDQR